MKIFEKLNASIVIEWGMFLAFVILAIVLWFTKLSHNVIIDWEQIGTLVSGQFSIVSFRAFTICAVPWGFDLITPGGFLAKISENSLASSIFMSMLSFCITLSCFIGV